MEKQERIQTILGIALLYTVITSLFTLVSELSSNVILYSVLFNSDLAEKFSTFFSSYTIWMVTVVCVVVILLVLRWRLTKGSGYRVLRDRLARGAAGVLIMLSGIIALSTSVMVAIKDIQLGVQVSQNEETAAQYGPMLIPKLVALDCTPLLLMVLQVLLGLYLLLVYRKKAAAEAPRG